MEKEIASIKKLRSRTSFSVKNSGIKTNQSGLFSRPLIRNVSAERDQGMTDKLHSLMENYMANDIPSIQKQ
jgi:hypothetical protein